MLEFPGKDRGREAATSGSSDVGRKTKTEKIGIPIFPACIVDIDGFIFPAFGAAPAALQRMRAEHGIQLEGTSLTLDGDVSCTYRYGQPDPASPLRYRDIEPLFQLDRPQECLPGLATARYDPATSGQNLIFTFIQNRKCDVSSTQMPPVPDGLRDMLKDYPEHLQTLQNDLNWVIEHPVSGVSAFERAVWAIEGALEGFISEARKELAAAEADGGAEAVAQAKKKEHLMLGCRISTPAWKMKNLITYFDNMSKEGCHGE